MEGVYPMEVWEHAPELLKKNLLQIVHYRVCFNVIPCREINNSTSYHVGKHVCSINCKYTGGTREIKINDVAVLGEA